jgi:hypothetical protein
MSPGSPGTLTDVTSFATFHDQVHMLLLLSRDGDPATQMATDERSHCIAVKWGSIPIEGAKLSIIANLETQMTKSKSQHSKCQLCGTTLHAEMISLHLLGQQKGILKNDRLSGARLNT